MTLDVLKWTIASYFEATGKVLPDLPDVLGPYDGETLVGKSVRVGATQIEFWDAGVIAVEPDQPGDKDVIFSCAVHGDETAPIEIVRDMLTDILAGKLQVTHRTLFLIANPAAIVNAKPDYALILPWNIAEEVITQFAHDLPNTQFVTVVPELRRI